MRAFLKALFTSLLVVIPVATSLADGLPKAIVDEYVYQVGNIQQGKPIVHDFIIKNVGDAPLTVKAQPC
ncbi:MAG: hypothetical protein ABFD81_16355 [Syntrophaceae bacterium]